MRAMSVIQGHAVATPSLRSLLLGSVWDRLLLLFALGAITLLWWGVKARLGGGEIVADIYRGDTLIASYPLAVDGQPVHLAVDGPLGVTEIVIDRQGARIVASPCPTQRCVLSGTHHHVGDMVACVPNRVLVTLRGSEDARFDAIVE